MGLTSNIKDQDFVSIRQAIAKLGSLKFGPTSSPIFADLTLTAPSNIYALSHDSFADFVANEHINHTSVTLTAGKGLSGGGDISTNRTFALDLTEMTGNVVWDDGSTDASITWTYALSGATDPVWTIGNNSMDLSTGALKQGGTQVMLVGDAPTAHTHDTDTLQLDGVNSNGGAFSFTTSGAVTFSQSIASANFAAAYKLTACATNAGALDFSAASKTLTVENNAVVSQDYSSDASPTFNDLTLSTPSSIYSLSHDSFADFAADEHIAHSGVTLTAGKGLSGGGDISASRTFAIDLTEMTGNVTWDDGSTDASITWTYALSGASDPVWTISNASMDLTTGALKQGGTQVMLVGDAPTAHTHDTDTLQFDGVNSNGGAFSFTTTGAVTFNQTLVSAGLDLTNITDNYIPYMSASGFANSVMQTNGTQIGIGVAPSYVLDVNGTGAFRSTLNIIGSGQQLSFSGATTNAHAAKWLNNGGNILIGIERAAGGGLLVGSSAYAGVIGTVSNTALEFGTNNTIVMTLSTAGALNITGSVAASNYGATNKLTACATNAGALDFSAASKTLTVEDTSVVSQDYSSDAAVKFLRLSLGSATAGAYQPISATYSTPNLYEVSFQNSSSDADLNMIYITTKNDAGHAILFGVSCTANSFVPARYGVDGGFFEFNGADALRFIHSHATEANNDMEWWGGAGGNTLSMSLQGDGTFATKNHYPLADNTYYLGKNDDDTPYAWKGMILKDQTTGTYYRVQLDSGAWNIVDLTD